MKWPWVSRFLYDTVEAAWCQERDHALDCQQRYDVLLDKYHALKLQGATVPEPTPTIERKAPDPVLEAITAKAGSDRRLRTIMSREAMAARAMQVPDEEIIQQIEQGVTADEDGIPA